MKSTQKAKSFNLAETFKDNTDINIVNRVFANKEGVNVEITIVNCQGMYDSNLLSRDIVPGVEKLIGEITPKKKLTVDFIKEFLYVPFLEEVTEENDLTLKVYTGQTILYFKEANLAFSIDTAKKPQRNPEQSNTEVPILGPRDNFIEDIVVNTALIRKRLPTNSLCSRDIMVGKRSQRTVKVLYIDDITDTKMLNDLCNSIEKIDIDTVLSGNQLMELAVKPNSIFPKYNYTGRPDFAVQSLMTGRIIVLIDTIPYAIITPINLFFLFKSAEDQEFTPFFNSLQRILRFIGLAIAIFLPGFWIALTTFHQNQLPFNFLASVVEARRGVPLPTQLEALLMIGVFELFREAGLRLPPPIGSTLSVVGGIIIGDAAISAGITSSSMVLVISGSIVAGFTVFNQALVATVSILRLVILLSSSFIGLFGFFVSLLFVITYMSNIRIFGVPYFSLVTNLNMKNVLISLARVPWKKYNTRPKTVAGPDQYRLKTDDNNDEN